jgi:hypothetical protein
VVYRRVLNVLMINETHVGVMYNIQYVLHPQDDYLPIYKNKYSHQDPYRVMIDLISTGSGCFLGVYRHKPGRCREEGTDPTLVFDVGIG